MSESNEHDQSTSKSSIIPQRWIAVFFGFLGLFNALSMRVCLSIAITEMTLAPNSTVFVESNHTIYIEKEYLNDTQLKPAKQLNPVKYNWSEQTQGLILSSFYLGYVTTNIFGGAIVQKLGCKRALGWNILLTSIFTLLTPSCIYWGGSTALIILRIAMGVGEGTTYPAVIDLLAHWIPEDERSRAGSVVFSGSSLGTIFGMSISGIILQHSKSGWPMVFYFYGIVGLISFLLNSAFCYSRPSENPYISDKELTYLKTTLNTTQANLPTTPWRYILKSPAVWASFAVKFSNSWGYITIVSDMPKYMKSVLKFSAQDNGYLSSIPHVGKWICALLASWIADKVVAERRFSITTVRKFGCTAASLGPAVFLVAATYAGSDGLLVVALQSIGLVFMGTAYCSVLINALDLSPNYASSIMGLGNGISNISGVLSPYLVGVLTPNQTMREWQSVFWIVFAILVSSSLVYLIYGSGEVQKWNDPDFLKKGKKSCGDQVGQDDELSPLNKS